MEQKAILQAQQLVIGYYPGKKKEKTIAGPLNLEILPGQLICLLGPNGSGKSTLIRTLAGLQPAISGTVRLDATLIDELSPAAMARKLSMVLTDKIPTGNMTVYSLVALGRYPYTGWLGNLSATDRQIIDQALASTRMEVFSNRKISQLSDGEGQKVMLARALAQDTPLIILDEPTAHLDIPNRVELMHLLHQLARETGKAILLSTHELDLALQAADQVWLIQQNGKLDTGVPEDLVLDGRFEAAFSSESFHFDKNSGTFSIHNYTGQRIGLSGDPAIAFWTKRALQREGFSVSGDKNEPLHIEVKKEAGTLFWLLHQNTGTIACSSIQQLLKMLSTIKV